MVRRMKAKDVPAVAQIEKECFSQPWSEHSLMRYADDKDSIFCVCEIDEVIVGYAGMYYVYPEGDITNVAIRGEYRGNGYAKALLEHMISVSKEHGVTEFTLEVRISNTKAARLYEKLGFKNEGIRKNFYDNPREDAVIMWKHCT